MAMLIFFSFVVADVVWWYAADRRLRKLRLALLWRGMLALLVLALAGYVLALRFYAWPLRSSQSPIPIAIHAFVYLWHFLVLPTALILLALGGLIRRTTKALWPGYEAATSPPPVVSPSPPATDAARMGPSADKPASATDPSQRRLKVGREVRPSRFSRRQALAIASATLPALAAGGVTIGALGTMNAMRVRRFTLTLPGIPARLDGATIAHVSDTHIGKFLHPERLPGLAQLINGLNADFVAFTGDLIDMALEDLPYGIDFLRSLTPRCGMAICEGNHDLMQNRGEFEDQMIEADLPIIIGQQRTLDYVSPDGRHSPVQFLATPWNLTDETTFDAVNFLRPAVRDDAFPILLAHHPHSFDAVDSRFPLVLSGHTHGGQIMLTPNFGPAQLRFRYISGLYQKPGANLIVNNGIGNWFPLRVNAPAEIIHITLKAMT